MTRSRLAIILVAFSAGTILSAADEPNSQRDRSTEAAITVEADRLLFTPGKPGEILITDIREKSEYRLAIPNPKERVTELRACRCVMRGFALAVETVPEKAEKPTQRAYYWITGWLGKAYEPAGKDTGKAASLRRAYGTGDRFLVTDENLDVASIGDPNGDTICILLTTFRNTEAGYDVTGYTYLNGCPVAAGGGGLLQRIATDPKTMKWINVDPDLIPPNP